MDLSADRVARIAHEISRVDWLQDLSGGTMTEVLAGPLESEESMLAAAPEHALGVPTEPTLDGAGDLSHAIEMLEGTVPAHPRPVSLVVDPFGRPRSPVSSCGMRRRERRRTRRRAF